MIIGVLTLTGAASNFAGFVLDIGSKSLFLSLLLTMVVCLMLGMGIPTIPNYIITSAIAAPALLKLGVPLIVSHMFVFYFGIMADLTPPVALAAFAAASIAKASPMKIGWKATHIAIAGFVIPYMAVYDPALMLQGGTLLDTAYVVFKAIVAIGLWGAASVGYLRGPLIWPERILATAAAFLLVVAVPWTDEAGFALERGVRRLALVSHARRAGGRVRLTRQPRVPPVNRSVDDSVDAICLLVAGVVRATLPGPGIHAGVGTLGRRRRAGKSATGSTATSLTLDRGARRGHRRGHGAAARRDAARRRLDLAAAIDTCRAALDAFHVRAATTRCARRGAARTRLTWTGAHRTRRRRHRAQLRRRQPAASRSGVAAAAVRAN